MSLSLSIVAPLAIAVAGASPPTMHAPVPRPEPQSCALIWADQGLSRVECPAVSGLQAHAEARLARLDLPPLPGAVRAPAVAFEASGSTPDAWRAMPGAVAYPRVQTPLLALSSAAPAHCLVGGRVSETGALVNWRVACNAPGDEDGATRRAYVAEAERFAAEVRILSDQPLRCHVLPLRFTIEGGPDTPPAPARDQVCPPDAAP